MVARCVFGSVGVGASVMNLWSGIVFRIMIIILIGCFNKNVE